MRKSTLFLSAVLTAFVMVMLTGVATTYQRIVSTGQLDQPAPVVQAQGESQTRSVADVIPEEVQPQPVNLTPEQAAALAAQVLGHDDLYSVESVVFNGETVFLVTFSSGDLVYVSLDGQIRSIGKVQVQTVVVKSGGRERDNGGGSPPPKQDHGDDDHEEDHKEDDGHED
jgi:hypothetical protein